MNKKIALKMLILMVLVIAAGAAAAMSQRQNVETPSAPVGGTTPFGDKNDDPLPF